MEQLHAVQSSNFPTDKLLLPLHLAEQLSQPIPNAILTLPTFAPDETTLRKRLQACQAAGWNAILCDTIAHLVLGKQLGLELHGGTGLNLTNRHSVDVIQQYGVSDTLLSVELTIRQALSCCDRLPAGLWTPSGDENTALPDSGRSWLPFLQASAQRPHQPHIPCLLHRGIHRYLQRCSSLGGRPFSTAARLFHIAAVVFH